MRLIARLCIVGMILVLAGLGVASTLVINQHPYEIWKSEQWRDKSRPTAPVLKLRSTWRGHGPVEIDGLVYGNRKASGAVSFIASGSSDERTPHDDLGYRLEFIEGQLPEACVVPEIARDPTIVKPEGAWISLRWDDGAHWAQDPYDFKIAVRAVDRAGNESRRSNVLRIHHDGSFESYKQRVVEGLKRMRAHSDSLIAAEKAKQSAE